MTGKVLFLLFSVALIGAYGYPDRSKIIDRINFARTSPQDMAVLITARYNTLAGAADAVVYLQNSPELTELATSQGVQAAAQLHANYLKARTVLTNPYSGCSGSHIENRINQVGTWTQLGENILTGESDEEKIVVTWIIDANSDNKINRRNIFENGFTSIGVGVSDGINSKNIVVVDFAGGFTCDDPCPNVPARDVDYECTSPAYTYGSNGSILSIKTAFSFICFLFLIIFAL